MTPLIRCTARDAQQERCQRPAGHDGDHKIWTSWTESKAWTTSRDRDDRSPGLGRKAPRP